MKVQPEQAIDWRRIGVAPVGGRRRVENTGINLVARHRGGRGHHRPLNGPSAFAGPILKSGPTTASVGRVCKPVPPPSRDKILSEPCWEVRCNPR